VPNRLCFRGLLIRLVTGASWVDIEAILDHQVSDRPTRPCERAGTSGSTPGVFEALKTEALAAFDRIVGLDLDHVALDGSLHKAPCGGEGTGPNPTDRAKLGWKWSAAAERHGIPVGWAIDGANRNDVAMLEPTLADVEANGLLVDIETLHLDRAMTPARSATGCVPRGSTTSRSSGEAPRSPASRSSRCVSGRGGAGGRHRVLVLWGAWR